MEKKGKPRKKQVDGLRAGKKVARPQDVSTNDIVLSLPAPMSKSKIGLAQKEMCEVWQDIMKEEAAFSRSSGPVKDDIKRLEKEKRRLGEKGGLAAGEQIAGLMEQQSERARELETLTNQFKANISGKHARADKLQSIIRSGVEYTQVPCRVEHDFVKKAIRTVRTDNGKVIEERTMTSDECQMELAQVEEPQAGDESTTEAES